MKKTLLIASILVSFLKIESSEVVLNKLSEYKKEIAMGTGAIATGFAVWKLYKNYVEYLEIRELQSQTNAFRLSNVLLKAKNKNLEKKLVNKKNQLNQMKNEVLYMRLALNQLNITNSELRREIRDLIDFGNDEQEDIQLKKEEIKKLKAEKTRLYFIIWNLFVNFYEKVQSNAVLKIAFANYIKKLNEKNAVLQEEIYSLKEQSDQRSVLSPESTCSSVESKENEELRLRHRKKLVDDSSASPAVNKLKTYEELKNEIMDYQEKEIYQFMDDIRSRIINNKNIIERSMILFYEHDHWKTKIAILKEKLNMDESVLLPKILEFEQEIIKLYDASQWENGRQIIKKLKEQRHNFIEQIKQDKTKHLKAIVNVIWYFYHLAYKKGQDFLQGAFGIVYERDLFFDFLNSYQDLYDRTGKSSHFAEEPDLQMALDIPVELRDVIILPNGMSHLLFSLIERRGYLFIKPEDHGISNIKDLAHHSLSYAASLYSRLSGNNEAQKLKKERIPHTITKEWKKLLDIYIPENENGLVGQSVSAVMSLCPGLDLRSIKSKYENLGKNYGINQMLKTLNQIKIIPNDSQIKAKEEFMHLINQYDHLKFRKGNEVILTETEFEQKV